MDGTEARGDGKDLVDELLTAAGNGDPVAESIVDSIADLIRSASGGTGNIVAAVAVAGEKRVVMGVFGEPGTEERMFTLRGAVTDLQVYLSLRSIQETEVDRGELEVKES